VASSRARPCLRLPDIPPEFFEDRDVLGERDRVESIGLGEQVIHRQAGHFDEG